MYFIYSFEGRICAGGVNISSGDADLSTGASFLMLSFIKKEAAAGVLPSDRSFFATGLLSLMFCPFLKYPSADKTNVIYSRLFQV